MVCRRGSLAAAWARGLLVVVGLLRLASTSEGSCSTASARLGRDVVAAALASDDHGGSPGSCGAPSTVLLQTRVELWAPGPSPASAAEAAPVPVQDPALLKAEALEYAKVHPGGKGLISLGIFVAICGVVWLLLGCRSGHSNAGGLLADESKMSWQRRLWAQVWALTWKNTKVSCRSEASAWCPCCTSCFVFVCSPVAYVALLTAVPNAITVWVNLAPEVVVHHALEYGRNYSNPAIWAAESRQLEDYLFEAPSLTEASLGGAVPGYAPLDRPPWSRSAPAGACYCHTLAVVGPGAEEFTGYLERRYKDWQHQWQARHGGGSITDQLLRQHECPANVKRPLFRVFDSKESVRQLLASFNYSGVNVSRGSPGVSDRLCGAVYFENDYRTVAMPDITIRTNITSADWSGLLATKRVNDGLMSQTEQSRAFYWYLRSGFLPIQELVEDYVLEERLGDGPPTAVDFVPLPTDPFTVNIFTQQLGGILASAGTATIMFAATIMNVASLMIRERITKQKELMRLMGLYDSALALSWFVLFSFCNFAASLGCTMLIYSAWVARSDASIMLLIIFLCATATSLLGMIVSTFVSSERLGALVAVGLYDVLGLCFLFLTISSGDDQSGQQGFGSTISNSVTSNELYWFSLIPQVAFTLSLQTYLDMDQAGIGCTFATMFREHNKYSVGRGLGILFADCILFTLLFLYFEQVMPHDMGSARPWYFPLDPAFWREMTGGSSMAVTDSVGETSEESDGSRISSFFEEETSEQLHQLRLRNLCITVRNLRMDFRNAAGVIVRAVDGLNLTMYQGECFCLLGHNGAGKSTTMAILTGMLPQTAGEVRVLGHRLPEDRAIVRSQMGFCMQQNVLWETLTVEEHVHMFGTLMGLHPEVVQASCSEALAKAELSYKAQALASSLSGGMKRKLNVALALLGNSRILFLDEPTAGMDPHTRRQLWEMLKQVRHDRIVCLTTHYMDEADELGDRVAIMVSGRAACSGTNAFLKQRFGCGYMLNFAKVNDGVPNAPIEAVVRRHCGGGLSEASTVGRELRLRVPFAGAEAFPSLMKELDRDLQPLGLESYGVGVSDLEDVFLKVASGSRTDVSMEVSREDRASSDRASSRVSCELAGVPQRRTASFGQQVGGLLKRRVVYASRDSRTFFCQLALPILNLLMMMAIIKYGASADMAMEYTRVVMDNAGWNAVDTYTFAPTLVSVGVDKHCPQCDLMGDAWLRQDYFYRTLDVALNDSLNLEGYLQTAGALNGSHVHHGQLASELAFSDFAVDLAHSSVVPQFGGLLYTDKRVTVLPNTTAQYSAAALLNLHYNTRIDAFHKNRPPNAGAPPWPPLKRISVAGQPFEATGYERMLGDVVSASMMGFVVRMAVTFIPAGIAGFIVMEREMQVRHQLMVSGASRSAYWLSNLLFDLLFGIVSSIGILIVFAALGATPWLSTPNIYATLTMLVLFPPACAMSTYFFTSFFTNSGSAMAAVLMANCFFGTMGVDMVNVFMLFENTRMIGYFVHWASLLAFPTACLGSGFQHLAMAHGFTEFVYLNPFSGFVFGTEYRLDGMGNLPPITLAGDEVFMLAFDIIFYAILLVFQDGHGEHSWFMHRGKCPDSLRQPDDAAVTAECERVSKLDPSTQVLVVKDVHKSYNGTDFAVRGITYAVGAGEVFGLLGVNGAGKTTTFKMMCGELVPSHGQISIGGKDVATDLEQAWKLIGYCPQFNALLDLLTVREHLELYGRIKGLKGSMLEKDVRARIRMFDLTRFEHSRASQLSGGNMRKLSCAIALIGEPQIVFLDEPSAGMDPVARRFMWDVIRTIAQREQGSTVILTTHSMEEADALCSRIAIQASGQVRCLGTPQQLKEWYGTGLELNVRLAVPTRQTLQALCIEWGGKPEETRVAAVAEALAAKRLGGTLFEAAKATSGLFSGRRTDPVSLSALAEWCLVQERSAEVERFLVAGCGDKCSTTCLQHTGRSLSYRLTGACPGGGPMSYGQLFAMLQESRERLGFADFQLSQGTLERTFNRLAAEDLEHQQAEA